MIRNEAAERTTWGNFHWWIDDAFSRPDEWHIEKMACWKATGIAFKLEAAKVPPPDKVGCHGPGSAVLIWEKAGKTLYLTVSAAAASLLLSTPERIEYRETFALETA